jgi:UDP-glucose:(heptosyl)LPS alpha-1,3-glucosyltransferase
MVRNQIIDTYNVNPAKIDIVYNGIESKELNYKNSFDKLSREFLIKEGQPTLLYVGSGFQRKGVREFLQIVAKLQMPNIKAFVVGKEKNIEYYQQLAIELKIDSQVIFTGPREDVNDFYTISDIFIFPTHYEPFGNVILEAMNFKNAVFTTRQNGASEILDDFFIMDKPDDFSIVTKITNLIDNMDKLESVKKENRIKSQQFSIDRNLLETLKVIDEVVN